mgnify:CR=1 FL=1
MRGSFVPNTKANNLIAHYCANPKTQTLRTNLFIWILSNRLKDATPPYTPCRLGEGPNFNPGKHSN